MSDTPMHLDAWNRLLNAIAPIDPNPYYSRLDNHDGLHNYDPLEGNPYDLMPGEDYDDGRPEGTQ